MKPDRNLISHLQKLDPRIIYLQLNDKKLDYEEIDDLIIQQYDASERLQLLNRGSTFYLSDKNNLKFSEEDIEKAKKRMKKSYFVILESPLKSIINCLKDGTEMNKKYIKTVLRLNDSREHMCYSFAEISTRLFREIFPQYKTEIFPGLIIFNDSMLLKTNDIYLRRLPSSTYKRKRCIKNIILFDL